MRWRRASNSSCGCKRGRRTSDGFTLVELLVVIGIIALLIAILLPALTAARAQSNNLRCSSNIRQICVAMALYASENKDRFPPNIDTPSPAQLWYDYERLGKLLQSREAQAKGPVVTCPEDSDALRSYAMNLWASSAVDATTAKNTAGVFWKAGSKNASRMILVTEKWSTVGSSKFGWTSPPYIGFLGDTPGRRFGGGGGLSPLYNAARFGSVSSELPFVRHRKHGGPGTGVQPIGRVNIGYADGHVQLRAEYELVDRTTGLSTLDTWWSPNDDQLER
jgi:prepilin-type N-terminal cleavage/methylation domain-containing protein/prepilin-type processing-associated H-X9-DG protein